MVHTCEELKNMNTLLLTISSTGYQAPDLMAGEPLLP